MGDVLEWEKFGLGDLLDERGPQVPDFNESPRMRMPPQTVNKKSAKSNKTPLPYISAMSGRYETKPRQVKVFNKSVINRLADPFSGIDATSALQPERQVARQEQMRMDIEAAKKRKERERKKAQRVKKGEGMLTFQKGSFGGPKLSSRSSIAPGVVPTSSKKGGTHTTGLLSGVRLNKNQSNSKGVQIPAGSNVDIRGSGVDNSTGHLKQQQPTQRVSTISGNSSSYNPTQQSQKVTPVSLSHQQEAGKKLVINSSSSDELPPPIGSYYQEITKKNNDKNIDAPWTNLWQQSLDDMSQDDENIMNGGENELDPTAFTSLNNKNAALKPTHQGDFHHDASSSLPNVRGVMKPNDVATKSDVVKIHSGVDLDTTHASTTMKHGYHQTTLSPIEAAPLATMVTSPLPSKDNLNSSMSPSFSNTATLDASALIMTDEEIEARVARDLARRKLRKLQLEKEADSKKKEEGIKQQTDVSQGVSLGDGEKFEDMIIKNQKVAGGGGGGGVKLGRIRRTSSGKRRKSRERTGRRKSQGDREGLVENNKNNFSNTEKGGGGRGQDNKQSIGGNDPLANRNNRKQRRRRSLSKSASKPTTDQRVTTSKDKKSLPPTTYAWGSSVRNQQTETFLKNKKKAMALSNGLLKNNGSNGGGGSFTSQDNASSSNKKSHHHHSRSENPLLKEWKAANLINKQVMEDAELFLREIKEAEVKTKKQQRKEKFMSWFPQAPAMNSLAPPKVSLTTKQSALMMTTKNIVKKMQQRSEAEEEDNDEVNDGDEGGGGFFITQGATGAGDEDLSLEDKHQKNGGDIGGSFFLTQQTEENDDETSYADGLKSAINQTKYPLKGIGASGGKNGGGKMNKVVGTSAWNGDVIDQGEVASQMGGQLNKPRTMVTNSVPKSGGYQRKDFAT